MRKKKKATSTKRVEELRERNRLKGRNRQEFSITDYEHERMKHFLQELRA